MPCLINICLLFSFYIVFGKCGATKSAIAEYAHHCDPTSSQCDSSVGLRCDPTHKICLCEQDAFYNKNEKKCHAAIGGMCKRSDPQSVETPCPTHASCQAFEAYQSLPKSLRNALLANSGQSTASAKRFICICSFGYAHDAMRQSCKPVQTFGKSCKKTIDCDVSAGLICAEDETCACATEGMAHYDKKSRKCVAKLGGKCSGSNYCEDGTVCENLLYSYSRLLDRYNPRPDYAKYAAESARLQKHGSHCVCNPGTLPSAEGKCVGSFRATCSEERPCNTEGFLACIDGICQCERGASALFDARHHSSSCQMPIGSNCDKNGPKCMGKATCVDRTCVHECEEGLSPTPIGSCLETYGSTCDISAGKFCNNFEGLACVEGACTCFDSTVKWDKKKKVCVAKEDGRCGKFKISEGEITGVSTDWHNAAEVTEVDHYVLGCAEGHICQFDETGLSDFKFCVKHE